jgi:DHA2 family multidrug resistance protein
MMGALDASIIQVALSRIRHTYGITVEQTTWLATAYILAAVLVMPLTGFLGRRFGQKRVYQSCLALFVLASIGCAMAPSFAWLVILRAIQGLGAGALQPTEQAILRQTFPAEQLGTAMGVFNLAVGIGPLTGPTLGGWIVDHAQWSWIFLINVPLGALGLAMVGRFVPADEPRVVEARLDWPGIAVLWLTLAALQYVLEEGHPRGWLASPVIAVIAAVAVVGAIAFVRRELRVAAPAVRLRVFREPTFALAAVTNAVAMAILLSGAFLLPVFLQELLGYTAMASGLAQLPRTIVMVIAMPILGRLYNRLPPRGSVFVGLVIAAIGQLLMARLTLTSTAADAMVALVLQGLGMSVVIIVLSTLALARVPRTELGDAAGLASLLRQVGVSTGLALLATLLARATHIPPGAGSSEILRARLVAFQHTFTVGAVLYVVLLPLVWFLRPARAP